LGGVVAVKYFQKKALLHFVTYVFDKDAWNEELSALPEEERRRIDHQTVVEGFWWVFINYIYLYAYREGIAYGVDGTQQE
jgi:hypothetical protein